MDRLVAYTAVFGPIKDVLHKPQNQPAHVRFEAFVDDPKGKESPGWILRGPEFHHEDPRRQARQHKILSHKLYPQADAVLWVDGCLTPIQSVQELVDQFLTAHDVAAFEHMERGCVYKELEACIRLGKDGPEVMRSQIARYRRQGYPYDNGMAETTALLRRHTDGIRKFNELWWKEIEQGSVRDQLSFDFLCWKHDLSYAFLEGGRTKSLHFTWRSHR